MAKEGEDDEHIQRRRGQLTATAALPIRGAGYVGGTFGSANWHDDGGSFGNGFGCGTLLAPAACNFDGGGNSGTKAAFTGGGYVGYNYQFGQWVIGIEGEFGYLGIGL